MTNLCQRGHSIHERRCVSTCIGPMMVYATELYSDPEGVGYCEGNCEVSRCLTGGGGPWEYLETAAANKALEASGEGVVLDFGSNIGWFTLLAAQKGFRVFSFEGSAESIDVMRTSLSLHGLEDKVTCFNTWIDHTIDRIDCFGDSPVAFVKIDLEGNEKYVIAALDDALKSKQIKSLLVEVSPVFNDSYPALVDKLVNYGYLPKRLGAPFTGKFDFHQDNFLFTLR